MIKISSKKYCVVLYAMLVLSCGHTEKKDASGDEVEKVSSNSIPKPEMTIEKLPASKFYFVDAKGDYNQHPKLIEELQASIKKNNVVSTECIGVYPSDPDTAKGDALKWRVGFMIPANSTIKSEGIFKVGDLQETEALVARSTVAHSPTHGLYCKVWLLEHGYVQTQATRMSYSLDSKDASMQATKIIFPITKRARQIPVITTSTINDNVK